MHDPTGLTGRHDLGLLALAGAVAFLAALSVFRLRSRMRRARPLVQTAWVFLCASVGGAGIWAAQYLALAAARTPVAASFEPIGVVAALLVAIVLVAGALGLAWSGADRGRLVGGGLLLSLAVAAMRWATLRAYIVGARLDWDALGLWIAVACGAVLCTAGLRLGGRARTLRAQLSGAALLTLAMAAMNGVAMLAMKLGAPDASIALTRGLDGGLLAVPVVLVALLVILGGLGAAFIDDSASRAASARLRSLTDASREGIVVLRSDGRIVDCNAAFAALVQRDVAALAGQPLLGSMLQLGDAVLRPDAPVTGLLLADDGEAIPVEVVTRSLARDGAPSHQQTAVLLHDLREQQAAEQQVRYLARHDLQTGLPNRAALHAMLREAEARYREGGRMIMLAVIAVANIKEINEAHGIDAADAMLLKIGERLKRFAGEAGSAARQGGADFAYVGYAQAGETDSEASAARARVGLAKLDEVLRRPFDYYGVRIDPRVVIGVAGLPHDAEDADALLAHAESALDRARRSGDTICSFRWDVHTAQRERRQLAAELGTAIAEDQLVLFYQPQAEALSGAITGFEALVRWRHPEQGLLAPDKFIPLAEAEGLIGALGDWVLRRACRDAAAWTQPLSVAVNLSPLQMGALDLPARVHGVLTASGLAPSRLELEVTESALVGDQHRALDILQRLKALGLNISMDDFGTGYSSLSSLNSFPFDKIKIDRSFVGGIGRLERSTVLVRAVLGIGRGLGVPVIAEGVETAEQLAFLCAERCASIQGYLIGRPAPVETFARTVHAPEPRVSRRGSVQ